TIPDFTLPSNPPFKNKNPQQQPHFINLLTFHKQPQNLNNHFNKRNLAPVHPPIQSTTYHNKQPQPLFLTQLVPHTLQFLQPKSQSKPQSQHQTRQPNPQQPPPKHNPFPNPNPPIHITHHHFPF
uniref:single-stranded DNA-binding protein n=1 Tax=Staphylococcus saprophyticus TaxID=29385 RepID=UPI001CD9FAE8